MNNSTTDSISLRASVVALYVFAMFITSDDNSLRLLSMTQYNIVASVMVGLTITSTLYSGRIKCNLLPEIKYLYMILIWIILSLILSKIIATKAISYEVYNYDWVKGVNSPALRGVSFIVRFFLSLFVIQFIISSIDSKAKYSFVMKCFVYCFGIFTAISIFQIGMLSFFNIEFGKIYHEAITDRVRIGSYVGEPSVLAGMLCSGIFPVISALRIKNNIVNENKFHLWTTLCLAFISLMFTSSASIIVAMIFSFILFTKKFINIKIWIILLISIVSLSLLNTTFKNHVLFKVVYELSSVNIRSLSWIVGFNSLLANPVSGVGIGQAPFFVAPYLPSIAEIPFEIDTHFNFTEGRYTPMNTYLEFATETGVIGLFLLLLFVRDIYKFGKNKDKTGDQRYIQFAFGAGLLAIAIAMNSFPGGLYLGYLNFMIGMYIAGLRIFSPHNNRSIVEHSK